MIALSSATQAAGASLGLSGIGHGAAVVIAGPARGDIILVPLEQAYFWTPEWQAAEAEADADIAAGRVERFGSMNEAITSLRDDN